MIKLDKAVKHLVALSEASLSYRPTNDCKYAATPLQDINCCPPGQIPSNKKKEKIAQVERNY